MLTVDRSPYLINERNLPIECQWQEIIIDVQTFRTVIARYQNGKTAGFEGILAELIKNAIEKLHRLLT